ncbi:hypothetical protein ACL01_004159 [Escherichia coli]|nr:hypothetical protein [Escherichia coli]
MVISSISSIKSIYIIYKWLTISRFDALHASLEYIKSLIDVAMLVNCQWLACQSMDKIFSHFPILVTVQISHIWLEEI